MYSPTLSDIEEDMCTCGRYYSRGHYMCNVCTDWMEDHFVSDQIREAGYKHGMDLGIDTGIRHTIYSECYDDYCFVDDLDIPKYAYIDRRSYERGYRHGYEYGYQFVYQIHRPVILHIQVFHKFQHFVGWVLTNYRTHLLFEHQLLNYIKSFL